MAGEETAFRGEEDHRLAGEVAVEMVDGTIGTRRCMTLCVVVVAMIARCPLDHRETNQCFVEIALLRKGVVES